MTQYINKETLVAEIKNLIKRAEAERVLYPQTIKAAKNYLLIEDYKKLLSIIDTIEMKGIGVDMGSPDCDTCVKTIWDGDKIVSNKAQKGEEVLTIEEKANSLIGCAKVGGCKSQDVNFCKKTYKDGGYMCKNKKMLLLMADFVIDKAIDWLRENATDYLDKIEDCYGGNEYEPQTWSFPEEFFKRFKNEIKNGDAE